MDKALFSLKDASIYCSISVPALRVWIRAGRLPAVRAGRRVLLSRVVLDERIAAGNLEAPAPGEGAFQKVVAGAPISLDKPAPPGV